MTVAYIVVLLIPYNFLSFHMRWLGENTIYELKIPYEMSFDAGCGG